MNKTSRQLAIKRLIMQEPIASQEELCEALRKQGFEVTQATLSRDFKELSIARISTSEGPRYMLNPEIEEQRLAPFISYEIESVDANESLIVIKTLPGRAQGVAEIIDSMHHPEILGTLAGDNTIFVTPSSIHKMAEVLKILRKLVMKPMPLGGVSYQSVDAFIESTKPPRDENAQKDTSKDVIIKSLL